MGLGFGLECEEAVSAWLCSPWFSPEYDCGLLVFLFCFFFNLFSLSFDLTSLIKLFCW